MKSILLDIERYGADITVEVDPLRLEFGISPYWPNDNIALTESEQAKAMTLILAANRDDTDEPTGPAPMSGAEMDAQADAYIGRLL